jgi:hypothetical protein
MIATMAFQIRNQQIQSQQGLRYQDDQAGKTGIGYKLQPDTLQLLTEICDEYNPLSTKDG